MKKLITSIAVLALAVVCAAPAYSLDRKGLAEYAKSLKGLKKADLKSKIYRISQPKNIISYGSGSGNTWGGFYTTDRIASTNQCVNRYSAGTYYFGSKGSVISGMNIEHSFPKSWWGGSKNNAYQDLFHLYPSPSEDNSKKSNYPMGKVTNPSILNGYEKVGTGSAGKNGTIQLCEPNDEWKGDFCRTYFYMATIYQNLTWQGTQGLQQLENNDWPTLQEWAYKLYLEWSRKDKVSQTEVDRNEAVYSLQGNRNLFIDFPTLSEYVWGDSINVAFDPYTAITSCADDDRYADYQPGQGGEPTDPDIPENPDPDKPVIEGTVLYTEDFSCITEGDFSNTGTSWNGNDSIAATSGWCAGGAVKLGTSSKPGSLQTKAGIIKFPGGKLCVTFDIKGWTSVEGDIQVTMTGCSPQTGEYTATRNDNFENMTFTFDKVSANPQLTIATTAKRAFIDNIKVFVPASTAITTTETCGVTADVYYNINGQKIGSSPTRPGIYIYNGRKVVVK
ncbi:MAG: endonuclease [Bacteroidales bacterium]|nr:endonuclease [Bacteroidales bacterium]MCM1148030.1 endonuclease [Bacteroidales bacterium]MCM1206847.1 endonuclease [Bacillota bacterium]MCM1511014.1 endonuclease [Clostridium sp.]